MKKQLSVFMLLSLALNITYSENKQLLTEKKLSTIQKNKTITDSKDNAQKLKNNQKKKNCSLMNSKLVKFGVPAVVTGMALCGLYTFLNRNEVHYDHNGPDDNQKDDNQKDNNQKDNNQKDNNQKDNNQKDSIPDFKEIFKNGIGSCRLPYNKYARLDNPYGRCWLCAILYSLFIPKLKDIYFECADYSIDKAIDFLDNNSISCKDTKYYKIILQYNGSSGSFGQAQKELNNYLKMCTHIDYDYVYNNFFANDKINFVFNDIDIKNIEIGQRKYYIDKFIFYFTNLRKLYAIGFILRCQIFRAMINNPGVTIDFCTDGYGIQISRFLDEVLKLPFIFREYDPANKNYNDYNSKLRQIESMITGTNHKFINIVNDINENKINAEPVHELEQDNRFCINRMINNYNAVTIENSTFFNDFNYKIVRKNGEYIMNETLFTYQIKQGEKIDEKYFVTTIGIVNQLRGSGHAFCIYPRYKIDENGNIKYIGFVFLSCTSSIYKDYFFPTKTGDFREIEEASCWLFDSNYVACSSYSQLLTEEDLKKNIQYYTVDDDIIKKFNL